MVTYIKGETTYTGSLMFGVQWDLVLKFIETKLVTTDTEIVLKLNSDSTTIGNYRDSTFKINRGKYAIASNWILSNTWNAYNVSTTNFVDEDINKLAQSNDGDGVLLITGSTDQNKLMNMYDMAGNVWEWTLEYTSLNDNPCAGRGGNYDGTGSNFPESRRGIDSMTNRSNYIGFRISLY